MNYEAFKRRYSDRRKDIIRNVYLNNQSNMKVKKEKTAITNLEKIFNAVFSISYKKGFQAMSMRDLSQQTGLSPSALYGCFSSKEELLSIIRTQGLAMLRETLERFVKDDDPPQEKLRTAVRVHLYLSELFRPWFYLPFMEVRYLKPDGFKAVKEMEEFTQNILCDILIEGEASGAFKPGNHDMNASMIKALQQEWYLKRWKYIKLKITVDQYAEYVLDMVETFCAADPQS